MSVGDDAHADSATRDYFSQFEQWYQSSYRCRTCQGPLFKLIFPVGREFSVRTSDEAYPFVGLKRVFTCARCRRFVTTASSEGNVRLGEQGKPGSSGDIVTGKLSEPHNLELEVPTPAVYDQWAVRMDRAGTRDGRSDNGFVPSRLAPALGSMTTNRSGVTSFGEKPLGVGKFADSPPRSTATYAGGGFQSLGAVQRMERKSRHATALMGWIVVLFGIAFILFISAITGLPESAIWMTFAGVFAGFAISLLLVWVVLREIRESLADHADAVLGAAARSDRRDY